MPSSPPSTVAQSISEELLSFLLPSPAVTSWLLINYSAFLNMHRGLINN